jgi:hypothetical protein
METDILQEMQRASFQIQELSFRQDLALHGGGERKNIWSF